MNGNRSLADIVSEIQNDFKDTPDTVLKEITAFIDRLAKHGFAGLELENK